MRRFIGDAIVLVGGVSVLVFTLTATDARVRDRMSLLVAGPPVTGMAEVATRLGDLMWTAAQVAVDWSRAHAFLTIFAVAALVLVTAVLRL